jgi:hypothetical protein
MSNYKVFTVLILASLATVSTSRANCFCQMVEWGRYKAIQIQSQNVLNTTELPDQQSCYSFIASEARCTSSPENSSNNDNGNAVGNVGNASNSSAAIDYAVGQASQDCSTLVTIPAKLLDGNKNFDGSVTFDSPQILIHGKMVPIESHATSINDESLKGFCANQQGRKYVFSADAKVCGKVKFARLSEQGAFEGFYDSDMYLDQITCR